MPHADRETPRSIAVIGIVMVLLTVLGFVGLGVAMKMNGYPSSDVVRWTPLALNLRHYGHWFVVVPVAWVICAIIIFRLDLGTFVEVLAYVVGCAALSVIPLLFLFAIANPFTRPLLIGRVPAKPSISQQDTRSTPGRTLPQPADASRN